MADALAQVLEEIAAKKPAPLYLVVGEEFLVRKASEELVHRLVPDAAAGLSVVTLDGSSPRELALELATMPLFPGPKVVVVHDPEFLAPKKARGDALGRAREAWKAGRRKEGARRILAIAARAGWSAADLDPKGGRATPARWEEELGISLGDADATFLAEVAAYCRDEGITAPESDEGPLLELFERGLPREHALVIAASEVDPKHALARLAKEKGRIVERKVAAKLKDLDLSQLAAEVLAPYGKRLAREAEALLKERVGGNMRLVQSELTKLAQYASAAVITEADVDLLVGHAREEEFLELSDAVQKRDLSAALGYVDEALARGAATLALLGAIASIVRTLVGHHERMIELSDGKPPRSYDQFQSRIFPRIEAEAKAAKARVPHPYAAFMGMQAAARYKREELLRALVSCAESDLALKLGGTRLVIDRLLWTVCGRAAPWESGLAQVRRDFERT